MLKRLAVLAAGLMLMLAPAAAQDTKIRFTLDWKRPRRSSSDPES